MDLNPIGIDNLDINKQMVRTIDIINQVILNSIVFYHIFNLSFLH